MIWQMMVDLLHSNGQLRTETEKGCQKISTVGTDGRLPLSDLDLSSGHTAYGRASLIDLYQSTYIPNFIEIGGNFFLKVTTKVLVKFKVK